MRLIFILAAALILAGCQIGPSLQSQMAAYIGAPEASIVQHFGVPVRQISVNGTNYLAYQLRYQVQSVSAGPVWGPYWGPGPIGPTMTSSQAYSCEVTFAVLDSQVKSFSLRGNDCN